MQKEQQISILIQDGPPLHVDFLLNVKDYELGFFSGANSKPGLLSDLLHQAVNVIEQLKTINLFRNSMPGLCGVRNE